MSPQVVWLFIFAILSGTLMGTAQKFLAGYSPLLVNAVAQWVASIIFFVLYMVVKWTRRTGLRPQVDHTHFRFGWRQRLPLLLGAGIAPNVLQRGLFVQHAPLHFSLRFRRRLSLRSANQTADTEQQGHGQRRLLHGIPLQIVDAEDEHRAVHVLGL